jgi:L-alanine-DL-glutamate epimerase-like enolase superfamily enzyme
MVCEWPLERGALGDDLLETPFRFSDGYVPLPEGPGLGIEIDEDALRRWAA